VRANAIILHLAWMVGGFHRFLLRVGWGGRKPVAAGRGAVPGPREDDISPHGGERIMPRCDERIMKAMPSET
jgi:hypothetical protein